MIVSFFKKYSHCLFADPLNANRIAGLDPFPRIAEQSCFFVNLKNHDFVAVLIRDQEKISGGIKIEITGSLSKR